MVIKDLRKALIESWGSDTAHSSVRDKWSKENKASGQCAVTALVVNKYLGGVIMKGEVEGHKAPHYWNVLPSGEVIDLTKSQFGTAVIEFSNAKKKYPKDMLKNKDFNKRYELLDSRVRTVMGL